MEIQYVEIGFSWTERYRKIETKAKVRIHFIRIDIYASIIFFLEALKPFKDCTGRTKFRFKF
jgi:hypothetical protein